ncbi:MAG: O-succinylbenzoate synthase, partial [uncultured Gemmatimonadaceae bacterium]
ARHVTDGARGADHAPGDPAAAQGAVPHLLGRLHRAAHPPPRAARRRRRGGVGRVRRGRAAELQRRDDRHRVACDHGVGGAASEGAGVRPPGGRAPRAGARLPRPPDGQGGGGDGVLGTRGRARGRAARPVPRRRAGRAADRDPDRHLARHPGDAGGARGARPRGESRRLPQDQAQDHAGRGRRVRGRGARRGRARRRGHGRRELGLHARRRGPARGAGRVRPHDDRAAARPRGPRAARRAAAAPLHAPVPRRVDHRRRPRARHDRARQRARREHQARTRRGLRVSGRDPRHLSGRGRAGVVRRDAGEWRGARVQRRARLPPQLLAPRGSVAERAVLGTRRGHARVDDGRRHGRRPARPAGDRRGGRRRPRRRPDGAARGARRGAAGSHL